jgi:hypothetical protein
VRTRAAAESIRAAAWRYAVGGDPFALSDTDADDAFLRHVETVLKTVEDMPLPPGAPDGHDITADMQVLRASPLGERKAGYLAGRLDDQIGFYDRRAGSNEGARRNWFWIGVVANLAGLTGGLLRFLDIVRVDLVGVAAAIAGAAVAWTQLNQHRTLATTYSQTKQQLVGARDRLASVDEPDWAEYVDSVEDVMTREHSIWLTKRATPGIPR